MSGRAGKGRWYWFKNWLYYHWLALTAALAVLWVGGSWACNAVASRRSGPDYQIAYVGESRLPQDTAAAVEALFAALGEDLTGDGQVRVQLNQYVSGSYAAADAAAQAGAAEMQLTLDLTAGQSDLFLLQDPARFQLQYQALACADGSCPADADFSAEGKALLWADCPVLAGAALGSYTDRSLGIETSGQNQALLAGLWLGRRCYYDNAQAEAHAASAQLWQRLTQNAAARSITGGISP